MFKKIQLTAPGIGIGMPGGKTEKTYDAVLQIIIKQNDLKLEIRKSEKLQ